MSYFRVQFICLILFGSYYLTVYAQMNIVQYNATTPTASNFSYPQSLFVDSDNGHIWVTDFSNNRVLRFDVSTLTAIDESHTSSSPYNYYLGQNYPNPFNPSTKIRYSIPNVETLRATSVQLKVYDVLGKEVTTLVDEYKPAGNYEVEFIVGRDSSPAIASGVYFYQLKIGIYIQSRKMILIK